MTTVYVLLAECGTSGGVTADAYPTYDAAASAGRKLMGSGYPCRCWVKAVDLDREFDLTNRRTFYATPVK